ncbi:VWFA and cache domain-containing protein 1-like isoform X2 [Lineus longissimus]|uniref:VWFA and cache domain-containing protein 1-like isoform X2 n=1 Tax=Lineus longissimus TaxID=88925 RepID=UPI00315CFAF7
MQHQNRCFAVHLFKMAGPSCCCCLGRFLIVILVTSSLNLPIDAAKKHSRRTRDLGVSGMVHFNNPKLLKDADRDLWTDDDWLKDRRQENLDPKKIGGIIITKEARRLSLKLKKITNEELGVTAMQGIFDSLPFLERTASEENQLLELTKRIETKFHQYLRVLQSNKQTVENLYRFHAKVPIIQKFDCCNLLDQDLKSENQYRCKVSRLTTCDLIPRNVPHGAFNPGRNLTQVFLHNVQYFPNLKWQYFISIDGIHNEYPAHNFQMAPMDCRSVHNIRHRDVFVSTIQPQRKHVVIMMDHGNSLSPNQLNTAKAIARHIIRSLSENDRVGLIGLSSKATYPRSDGCLSEKLAPLTYEAKDFFMHFIDSLGKMESPTDHTLGFFKAFDMIHNSLATSNQTSNSDMENDYTELSDEAMIMYISRGLLSSLTEAKEVMKTIAMENGRMGHKVMINTYAVIDDGKPIMYEKSFLQDIADQNFAKYDVPRFNVMPVIKGEMLAVNTTRELSASVGTFFAPLNRSTMDLPHFSLPYIDAAGKGLITSITQPTFYNEHVIGITGIDLHLGDLVEDVTYYDNDRSAYSFLINTDGYIIMHPSMARPVNSEQQPMHTDIQQFENYPGFDKIRTSMLLLDEGLGTLYIPRNETSESVYLPGTGETIKAKYLWKRVPGGVPVIVCLKVMTEDLKRRDLKNVRISGSPDMVSYRLDILPSDKNCMHLKTLSTPETSTMYLSPTSFIDPFKHLMETETKKMIQGYLAYLKDETKLIANPGLKTEIRCDATALARINSVWVNRYKMSYLNDYIVRRYVATPSGVFRMYPGTLMHNNYAPDKRPWYTRAMEYPGDVTLTAPYLDVGGAGYIVTVSHSIYEGKAASMHTPDDRVVAIMGIDFTLRFMYKLLIDAMPNCGHSEIRCFVFDDKGYLIAHPGLIEPNGKGPVEMQHITHMEPLVANDILNHRHFVKKTLCNGYSDRKIQRYYHFNTSLEGVLTNLVHGEHCAKYQITSIPGTNTFLGIVNQTCNMITAFCPCSMVDRLCLNCHRMEQSECECPCECPLEMNFCTGSLLNEENRNPSCPMYPEEAALQVVPSKVSEGLPQCYKPHCEDRRTKDECFGVIDCEWCQRDSDGETPLMEPYCATQRVCFGGVYGAPSPYRDEIKLLAQQDEQHSVRTTPVGPVAGGIMGCFLVLALAVYCYRHHVHRNNHQYITSIPDTGVRMSQLDNEQEDIEPHEEPGSGHTNIVLASFENAASISPYRVNTMYRRPTTGDSDHGYSTMTPHEDSEQASTTCIEPLIVGKDRYKPSAYISKAPAIPPPPSSGTRRSRSPTPPQTRLPTHHTVIPEQHAIGPMTVLPESSHHNPHHVIANVQVHMVDTH